MQFRSKLMTSFLSIFFFYSFANAQFAPIAGQPGSTAIYKDSSILVAWATQCVVERGLVDISQPSLGTASAGSVAGTLGMAGDGFTLSLGDGGQATLTFEHPIQNGPGADFVVFENAFNATFLELAFVEVSSDGQNFVRFPAISNTDTSVQVGGFGNLDATRLYNFAGKYRANYGTPFDLQELAADSAILNLSAISHVRIVDAVGCIQDAYATRDSRGIKVNDPWSTPFPSSGFDLDAIGVIHQNTTIAIQKIPTPMVSIFPNPVRQGAPITVEISTHNTGDYTFSLYNLQGQLILELPPNTQKIPTQNLPKGAYLLKIQTATQHLTKQLIVY